MPGLSSYPATAGEPALREAIAGWVHRRYGVTVDPGTQVLPVNGSREALFAFAQTVIDPTKPGATVVCPNPFYQIYEGAALLAGARTAFVASDPARNFAADWGAVDTATWARTQLLYVCSPGNPTGAVMPLAEWRQLFELSDRHSFVIASDECYSEIYFRDEPPLGSLQAARALGRDDFRNLVAFTSLSKRSSVPGLRSGFVAGDAALLKPFLLYRTYHGSAMGPLVQRASIAAWDDEAHVVANRELYRAKFAQVTPLLLQRLQGVADRSAQFVGTLVAVRHAGDPQPLVAVGRWLGRILDAPRGQGGFGYDPLMFIPELGATVAELDAETKNRHSHRAQAMAQMRELLREAWRP